MLREIARRRAETAIEIAQEEKWDLFILIFTETDVAQHLLWDNLQALSLLYQDIDRYLCELVRAFRDIDQRRDTIVIIVSDHGFGPSPRYAINLNSLIDLNDLNLRDVLVRKICNLIHTLIGHSFLEIYVRLGRYVKQFMRKINSLTPVTSTSYISLCSTVLYTRSTYIKRVLYLKSKILVKKGLLRNVWQNTELYWGPYASEGPDLVYLARENFSICINRYMNSIIVPTIDPIPGSHHAHEKGIFVIHHESLRDIDIRYIPPVNVYDISPIVLWLLGLPIPKEMDGKVPASLIKSLSQVSKIEEPRFICEQNIELKWKIFKLKTSLS